MSGVLPRDEATEVAAQRQNLRDQQKRSTEAARAERQQKQEKW